MPNISSQILIIWLLCFLSKKPKKDRQKKQNAANSEFTEVNEQNEDGNEDYVVNYMEGEDQEEEIGLWLLNYWLFIAILLDLNIRYIIVLFSCIVTFCENQFSFNLVK